MSDSDSSDVRLRSENADAIQTELEKRGVTFDRWHPMVIDRINFSTHEVLKVYKNEIAELNHDGRYKVVDVVQFFLEDPYWVSTAKTARQKFLAEHRHTEDEVRFFLTGQACFYLHITGEVVAVVCTGGDLISVPANTRHWFDMGEKPGFAAIRFFEDEKGWVGKFTRSKIHERFPSLEKLV